MFKMIARLFRSTSLFEAARNGNLAKVKEILVSGVNPNATFADGITALMLATEKGHSKIVKALLDAGANPNAAKHGGVTALMAAARLGHC